MIRFIRQIDTYIKKFLRLFISTQGWIGLVLCIVISFTISLVTKNGMFEYRYETESGCFALVSACIWIGYFNSILSVCRERDIIKREYYSGLFISAYISARAYCEMLVCIFEALIMVSISTLIYEIPDQALIFDEGDKLIDIVGSYVPSDFCIDLFVTFFIILVTADFMGILVSSICKSTTVAMTVIPFLLIIQLVFSGMLFELEGYAQDFAKLTISKWGMEILGTIADINGKPYSNGKMFVEDVYKYSIDHVLASMKVLGVFCLVYYILSIIFLSGVRRDKR